MHWLEYLLRFGRYEQWNKNMSENQLEGTVVRLIINKGFGFIKRDNSGIEYFFHKEGFNGHWLDLIADYNEDRKDIRVSFDIVKSDKGPRASNVRRLDYPNQSV